MIKRVELAAVLTALCACTGAPSYEVRESSGVEESPGMRRIRARQNLVYDDGQLLELNYASGATDGFGLFDAWLRAACRNTPQTCAMTGATGCELRACELHEAVCKANIALEISAATEAVTISFGTSTPTTHTFPPQSRATRAAMAEQAVRYSMVDMPLANELTSSSCLATSIVSGATNLEVIESALLELNEIAHEAAERAESSYAALSDELLANPNTGATDARDVRVHAARLLAGADITQGVGVPLAIEEFWARSVPLSERLRCRPSADWPAVTRAVRLIRESGLPPSLVSALPENGSMVVDPEVFVDGGTSSPSMKRRLARIWGDEDRIDSLSADEFLDEYGLTYDDIQAARERISREYVVFERDLSLIDETVALAPDGSLDVSYYAATSRPPSPLPEGASAGIAIDPGLNLVLNDTNSNGTLPDGLSQNLQGLFEAPSLALWLANYRAAAATLSASADTSVASIGRRMRTLVMNDARGWFFTGDLAGNDTYAPEAYVLSEWAPHELVVVAGSAALRCATEGSIEGVRCGWGDVGAIEGSFGYSANTAWYNAVSADELSVNGDLPVLFDLAGMTPKDAIYLLALRSGATPSQPGSYEFVGVMPLYRVRNENSAGVDDATHIVHRPITPRLTQRAGRLANASTQDCSRPRRSCAAGEFATGNLPLEDSLTDDGNQYESSWARYMSLARSAANEADLLGQQTINQGIDLDRIAEAAALELADLCGGTVDLSILDEVPDDEDPIEWLSNPANGDASARAALLRCLGDDELVPLAALGEDPVCIWWPDADLGRICEVEGTPTTDIGCPRVATAAEVSAGTCAVPDGGGSYTAALIAGDALLQLVPRPENANAAPIENMCKRFRDMRSAYETSGINDAFRYEWNALFGSGRFGINVLSQVASRIRFAAEPGTHASIYLDDERTLSTGTLTGGPATNGICSGTPVGCEPSHSGSLACSTLDCSDPAERVAAAHRWGAASVLARWMGQRSLQDFGAFYCIDAYTGTANALSFVEAASGTTVGRYTSDDQPGTVYCLEDTQTQNSVDVWLNGCDDLSCSLLPSYGTGLRHGASFVRFDAERPWGNRRVIQLTGELYRSAAASFVRRLASLDGDVNPWRIFERHGEANLRWITDGEIVEFPWYQHNLYHVGFGGDAGSIERRQMLDALELLCMAQESNGGGYDFTVPIDITADDIDQIAAGLAAQADVVRALATNSVVRDLPSRLAESARRGPATPLAFEGQYGTQASLVIAALQDVATVPASLADQLRGMARDVRLINNVLRRIELQSDLRKVNLFRDIANQVTACAVASSKVTTLGGVASAAITCANSALQIVQALKADGIQEAISAIDEQDALTRFLESSDNRATAVRGVGDRMRSATNQLSQALNELRRLRGRGRRSLSRALGLHDESIGVVFRADGVQRLRYDVDRQRYERAHRDAIRMSFLARRAIEQRFGVDLSSLGEEMTLVAAPSTWADSLCTMEGIDYETLRDPDDDVSGAYSEAFVGDYVTRLEKFVESYRLDYPFVDGEDTAVISVRDDVHNVRGRCTTPSSNLLYWSDDITHISATPGSVGGWTWNGCNQGSDGPLPNCLSSDEVVSLALTSEPGVGAPRAQRIVFGPPHPDCEPMTAACPCPSSTCGYDVNVDVSQRVELEPGDYRVAWWTRAHGDIAVGSVLAEAQAVAQGAVAVSESGAFLAPFGAGALRTLRTIDAPGGDDDWVETFFVFSVPEEAEYDVHIRRWSIHGGGNELTLAGLSLSRIGGTGLLNHVSSAELEPTEYESTDASRTVTAELCEDTDGTNFRNQVWIRRCEYLCDTGFSASCASENESEYCFWETEFSVFEEAIDRGVLFNQAGLARGNFNYRAESIALNFVGSAVRDCEDSATPSTCFASGFVPYSLEHIGPYRIRDHAANDYDAPLFTGRIQQARGLAAERYLTNPLSSADRGLIEPYMQRQFRGRPLSGTYRLRVWDDDGVNFDGIEDVQIVLNYRYWTRLN